LERLAGTIQEVEQHLEDDHVDKGDTQRSIGFYKEVAAEAARSRRQKEDELEVVCRVVLVLCSGYTVARCWCCVCSV
jgi:hypothetical protein